MGTIALATAYKDSGKAYGPYLETSWGQGPPYNNFCPMDPTTNQRSIAGCPAVAMAQIINYFETIMKQFLLIWMTIIIHMQE